MAAGLWTLVLGCSAPSSGTGGHGSNLEGGLGAGGGDGGTLFPGSGAASANGGGPGAGGGTSAGGGTGAGGSAGSGGGTGNGGAPGSGGSPGSGGAGTGTGGSAANTDGGTGTGSCGTLRKDCDDDPGNGCETNTGSDATNCGDCDNVCPSATNGSPYCFIGQCKVACNAGFAECDDDPGNGCETNTKTDKDNCGACHMSCGANRCVGGACECATTSVAAKQTPLDMYIVFDQSGSMDQDVTGGTKWAVIKGALTTFVQNPGSANMGVGIMYFPQLNPNAPTRCSNDNDCNVPAGNFGTCQGSLPFIGCALGCSCSLADNCQVASYSNPDVGIGMLPGVAGAIVNSLNAHNPGGGTPTYPALQGAYPYATSWAIAHPDRRTIVVLASDGNPTGCGGNNTVGTIASNLVTPARTGTPSVLTFVVGVGSSLTSLNQIAQAGGTNQAFIVDTAGADPGGQFLQAMAKIRGSQALGCQYSIPAPPSGTPDYSKVNVQYTPSTGSSTVLKKVNDLAACTAQSGGWYYDNDAAPTQIIACPTTCSAIQGDPTAQVEVLLGCPTSG